MLTESPNLSGSACYPGMGGGGHGPEAGLSSPHPASALISGGLLVSKAAPSLAPACLSTGALREGQALSPGSSHGFPHCLSLLPGTPRPSSGLRAPWAHCHPTPAFPSACPSACPWVTTLPQPPPSPPQSGHNRSGSLSLPFRRSQLLRSPQPLRFITPITMEFTVLPGCLPAAWRSRRAHSRPSIQHAAWPSDLGLLLHARGCPQCFACMGLMIRWTSPLTAEEEAERG